MIRVMIVDDQHIMREGLRALLELAGDLQVVAEADNGKIALERLGQLFSTDAQPDVVLMDVRMPLMDGVAATREITARFAGVRVLMLTTFDDSEYVSNALRHGAAGYLLKDIPARELAEVIRLAHRGFNQLAPGILSKVLGQMALPPSPARQLPSELQMLTPRERDVLQLLARGASNLEIAQKLYISEGTVKFHVTNILDRLNLRNRTQAANLANVHLAWLESEG